MTISEDCLNGSTLLNLGVSGSKLEDMIALYQICKENEVTFKNVIIGADPTLFNENDNDNRWESIGSYYYAYKGRKSIDTNLEFQITLIENLFSPSYFKSAVSDIPTAFEGNAKIEYVKTFINDGGTKRPDGSIYYAKEYRENPQSWVDADATTCCHGSFYNFESFSEERKNIFIEFVETLHNNGTNIIIWCCPYHPIFYKRALEILQNDGDQNEALDYLNKEITEHPKNGYAYYMMGNLYNNANMSGDAIGPTNKAIEYLQKDKEWITYAYRQRANINLKLGNEKSALDDWALSLKSNPKDINTLIDRAEYYYQNDMYAEADADYEKICKIEPGNTLGYMGKGRNALENGRFQEAAELFTYCLRLDNSFSQAYAFRAESYFHMNRINEGIDDVVYALALDGNNKAYRLMMSIGGPDVNTLLAKLKVQKIKEPNKSDWPFYIGLVYEGQKIFMKAIESYKETATIEANDVVYARMSNCFNELGDYEMALENINKAMELDPNDADYVSTKADLLYDMGKGQESIAAYDDYI